MLYSKYNLHSCVVISSWQLTVVQQLSLPRKEKVKDKMSIIKGIVSRDFKWLQMILMNRTLVPGVPQDVYFFNSCFHIVLQDQSFEQVKHLLKGVCHKISDLQFFFMIRTHLGP